MALRFNSPPNWPSLPHDFVPNQDWQPDPSWGNAPEGWNFWVDDQQPAPLASAPQLVHRPDKKVFILGFIATGLVALLFLLQIGTLAYLKFDQHKDADARASAQATARESTATDPNNVKYEDALAKAQPFPAPQEFPADSYKEYTSETVHNTSQASTKDTDVTVFGAQRPEGSQDLAWVEFYYTPSSSGTGYISESRATQEDSKGEALNTIGHETSLYWSKAGTEQRMTFWIAPVLEGHNDIFEIHLPQGSQWKIRIHPANHAPTITSLVKSTDNQSQAFYYDPSANSRLELLAHNNGFSDITLIAYGQENATGETIMSFKNTVAGNAKADTHDFSSAKGPVPLTVFGSGWSWIIGPATQN